jgi:hypothetical protein
MLQDLERRGRTDLVAAVQDIVARFRKWDAWKRELDWKGAVKRSTAAGRAASSRASRPHDDGPRRHACVAPARG